MYKLLTRPVNYVIAMWTAYGQPWSQTMEVIRSVSTQPTANLLNALLVRSYTQFCIQFTAAYSTVKNQVTTTVNSSFVHSIHLAYYYNYIYIKKGY